MSETVSTRQVSDTGPSSGRFRFEDNPDQSCLPCHKDRVGDSAAHSRHRTESEGSRCVSCHMPMTEFARMRRSDHSMRAPMPAASLALKSPNACNLCHQDQNAAWADHFVREWYPRDYQAPVLHWAGLIEAARKRDWSRLPEMLAYVQRKDRDEVVANSLIRLLRSCEDEEKWPAIMNATRDASPLVRASVAEALGDRLTPETVNALLAATDDEYRLVRIRAAAALAGVPREMLDEPQRKKLDHATAEFMAALNARPDDHGAHYNLGNFLMNRGEFTRAIASFNTSLMLQPRSIPPRVNVSLAYNALGQNKEAEASLRAALRIDPSSVAANFNLGLLLAELGRLPEAEKALRTALRTNPTSAIAATNLGIILAQDRIEEGLKWLRHASQLQPHEPKYAHTLAFYLREHGDTEEAIQTLRRIVEQQPGHAGVYMLLGRIHEEQGDSATAVIIYTQAMTNEEISEGERYQFAMRIEILKGS